jgi:hypothetical protein
MTTLAGDNTYFTNIDSGISQTQWESLIDAAIDKINAHGSRYGVDIPNMGGTAGSKSWTGTSAEAGWIRTVAVAVYQKEYKKEGADSKSESTGGISSSGSASAIESLAEEAAQALKDLDMTIGPDASFG